jgi:serine/threonine protein kinase
MQARNNAMDINRNAVADVARILGKGSFATIVLHVAKDGKKFARKIFVENTDTPCDVAQARELAVLVELQKVQTDYCKHVVRQCGYGVLETPYKQFVAGLPYIDMEYVQGVDMATLVQNRRTMWDTFTTPASLGKFVFGCVKAVAFIHLKGIVHLDIKPENLMLTAAGNVPVLVDFGIAQKEKANSEFSVLGTRGYQPPEYWKTGAISKAFDVFSLGATLFEIVHGTALVPDPEGIIALEELAYGNNDDSHVRLDAERKYRKLMVEAATKQAHRKVRVGDHKATFDIKHCVLGMITLMTEPEVENRPSIADIQMSPVFESVLPGIKERQAKYDGGKDLVLKAQRVAAEQAQERLKEVEKVAKDAKRNLQERDAARAALEAVRTELKNVDIQLSNARAEGKLCEAKLNGEIDANVSHKAKWLETVKLHEEAKIEAEHLAMTRRIAEIATGQIMRELDESKAEVQRLHLELELERQNNRRQSRVVDNGDEASDAAKAEAEYNQMASYCDAADAKADALEKDLQEAKAALSEAKDSHEEVVKQLKEQLQEECERGLVRENEWQKENERLQDLLQDRELEQAQAQVRPSELEEPRSRPSAGAVDTDGFAALFGGVNDFLDTSSVAPPAKRLKSDIAKSNLPSADRLNVERKNKLFMNDIPEGFRTAAWKMFDWAYGRAHRIGSPAPPKFSDAENPCRAVHDRSNLNSPTAYELWVVGAVLACVPEHGNSFPQKEIFSLATNRPKCAYGSIRQKVENRLEAANLALRLDFE